MLEDWLRPLVEDFPFVFACLDCFERLESFDWLDPLVGPACLDELDRPLVLRLPDLGFGLDPDLAFALPLELADLRGSFRLLFRLPSCFWRLGRG